MYDMHQDIPDRPDLKMGGEGDNQWIEIDFYWEREGVCLLLDQPERHSPYTRRIDLARDAILRELGLAVRRTDRGEFEQHAGRVAGELRRMLSERRTANRRVYNPSGRSVLRRGEPMVNVTRNVGWLAGRPGIAALPNEWPRHYDRGLVSWNYDPGPDVLLPVRS